MDLTQNTGHNRAVLRARDRLLGRLGADADNAAMSRSSEPPASGRARPPRRILLGVTGGIAAYKAAELVRRLSDRGAAVQVVMTPGAQRFVQPLTFQALSARPVRTELFDPAAEAAMGHIELARWAELVLVAPASADFLARLAGGRADDLLSTLCLATRAPVWVAPAMNQLMWSNAATQANVALLTDRAIRILGPASGDQACGEVGPGRMLEPEELVRAVFASEFAGPLSGRHVLVTAGPTREALDPVRFISNRSSGKMGFAVAEAARDAGARVTLISGPVSLATPPGLMRIDVESAEQMYEAVHAAIADVDIYIGAAAVADYRPATCAERKIKKTSDELELALTRAPDILVSIAQLPARPFVVGFAAETNDIERHARDKLVRKQLDLIAANDVSGGQVFEREDNALLVLWPGGRRELQQKSKSELASELMALIAERYRASQRAAVTPLAG
jgi:phosphopantothenoylcysteine decarboxylase / phosphopantothenate---cysteine ligase